MERLDKIISNQMCIGRTEARKLIKIGKVTVNGKTVKNFSEHFEPSENIITVNSKQVEYNQNIYLMLNKPKGVLSATNDKSRTTVLNLIPKEYRRNNLSPVGRLDKDTTGLLLLTDDGEFLHRVISPKSNIIKKYIAEVDSKPTEEICGKFKTGIVLADGTKCMPAEMVIISNKQPYLCEISIMEGKYHQIKRMLGTVGLGVNNLKRVSVGGLTLDESLDFGESRILTEQEKNSVLCKINK